MWLGHLRLSDRRSGQLEAGRVGTHPVTHPHEEIQDVTRLRTLRAKLTRLLGLKAVGGGRAPSCRKALCQGELWVLEDERTCRVSIETKRLKGALGISTRPPHPALPQREAGDGKCQQVTSRLGKGQGTDSLWYCSGGALFCTSILPAPATSAPLCCLVSGNTPAPFCITGRHTLLATVGHLEFAHPHSTCHVQCVCSGIICYLSAVQQPCMKNNTEGQIN